MPRELPSNPALIVAEPAPLETFAGFPHAVVSFPIDDLLAYGGFSLLPAAPITAPSDSLPAPLEPEASL